MGIPSRRPRRSTCRECQWGPTERRTTDESQTWLSRAPRRARPRHRPGGVRREQQLEQRLLERREHNSGADERRHRHRLDEVRQRRRHRARRFEGRHALHQQPGHQLEDGVHCRVPEHLAGGDGVRRTAHLIGLLGAGEARCRERAADVQRPAALYVRAGQSRSRRPATVSPTASAAPRSPGPPHRRAAPRRPAPPRAPGAPPCRPRRAAAPAHRADRPAGVTATSRPPTVRPRSSPRHIRRRARP